MQYLKRVLCERKDRVLGEELRDKNELFYHHDSINLDAYPSHFDVDFFETEGEEPMSAEEQYKDAGMCYSQDSLTFLDLFDADEYAEYRKDNLFYPFASKEEWEIANFLLLLPLVCLQSMSF
jgi:hypothetical protein